MSSSDFEAGLFRAGDAKFYEFHGFDMQWSYYGSAGEKVACCPTCRVRIRTWERPYKDRQKRLPYDFNDTYDGKVILSARAKEHFDVFWPEQMLFRQIFRNAWEAEPVRVLRVTNPDEVTRYSGKIYRRGEKSIDGPCPDCGSWFCHTFKSFTFCFGNPEIIEQGGIFRTDMCIGWNFRRPLWLAGPRAAFAISANFREVWLRPFEQMEDGSWRYESAEEFRVEPAPGAIEPTYPDYLE